MNLFSGQDADRAGEVVETLLETPALTLERIVSLGQASPEGFWYEQDRAEWVMLAAGKARLRFEDEAEDRILEPGDCVLIGTRRRHRVTWTDPHQPTIWIALHFDESPRTP